MKPHLRRIGQTTKPTFRLSHQLKEYVKAADLVDLQAGMPGGVTIKGSETMGDTQSYIRVGSAEKSEGESNHDATFMPLRLDNDAAAHVNRRLVKYMQATNLATLKENHIVLLE